MNKLLKKWALLPILCAGLAGPVAAQGESFEKLSCRDLIDGGWKNMPDVADYIHAKPGADKLGYGSECHLGSLVFSQCWLEPTWSVKKAIDVLIQKAVTGKRLPETPVCGA